MSVQLYQQPTTFDPLAALNGADGDVSSLQFQGLVKTDVKGQVSADLAKSWDLSADSKQLTFHLGDFKWSDGQAITADDVVFSYNAEANPKSKDSLAGNLSVIEGYDAVAKGTSDKLTGVTAPDAHTVVVSLTQPDPAALTDLNVPVVPQHVLSDKALDQWPKDPFFHSPTVGSGPFVFSKWVNDDEIEFAKNPYWPGVLKVDNVYVEYLTQDVALAQLKTGEIDVATLSAADLNTANGYNNISVVRAPGTSVLVLATALDNGLLADVRVRQAIMYAIDRKALADKVEAGAATIPDTVMFAPSWTIPPDLTHYTYDPKKAKELLKEANWNSKTVVKLQVTPGQSDRVADVNIIAGELQAVGINAKVENIQPAQITEAVKNRTFDLLITVLGMNVNQPSSINDRFLCSQKYPKGINVDDYCNPELDKLLEQGATATTQAEQKTIYTQVQSILNKDLPMFPLYVPQILWGVNKRLHGWEPLNLDPFGGIENWSVS